MEEMLKRIIEKLDNLEKNQLETNQKLDCIEKRLDCIEKRQEAIFSQTATLTEFRTEVNEKLDELAASQESISEILGRHEVQIMNLRKRPI